MPDIPCAFSPSGGLLYHTSPVLLSVRVKLPAASAKTEKLSFSMPLPDITVKSPAPFCGAAFSAAAAGCSSSNADKTAI